MSELVKKSTEDIKDKLYDCLQSTFEEIETVKNHLSCIYEGVANDLDILKTNNEHYSETDELDGYGYGCKNKTCLERIRNKAIDEFAERMSLEISESIIWDMLATMSKNGSLSDTSDKIVDYVIDTSKKIAEQAKAGGENE